MGSPYWDHLTILHELAKVLDAKTYLEVGVREGASLCAVLAREREACGFARNCLTENETFLNDEIIKRVSEAFTLREPAMRLYLFDAWTYKGAEGGKERVTNLLVQGFGLLPDKIRFINGDSKATLPKFFADNPDLLVDLAFIDGFHDDETASSDLENCVPHTKVIALHDLFHEDHPLRYVFRSFVKQHGFPTLSYNTDFYDTGVAFNMAR